MRESVSVSADRPQPATANCNDSPTDTQQMLLLDCSRAQRCGVAAAAQPGAEAGARREGRGGSSRCCATSHRNKDCKCGSKDMCISCKRALPHP